MIENLVHTEVKIGDESLDTLEENKRSEEKVAPVVLASQYAETLAKLEILQEQYNELK